MASSADMNDDLLAHCLSFSGRKGLAAASQVCRKWADVAGSPGSWEAVLSTEDDWPSLFFAESNPAQGPRDLARSRKLPGAHITSNRGCFPVLRRSRRECASKESSKQEHKDKDTVLGTEVRILPWPRIMRLRHTAPPAVVIDAGSGYCKFGWSTDPEPCGRIASFLEFGSVETPLLPRILSLFKSIFRELSADPREHPVLVTEPLQYLREPAGDKAAGAARVELREAVYAVLFNCLQVPAVLSTNQAVLAAFQARQLSAVVVNVGFKATTVVPIVRGRVLPGGFGIETLNVAATRVTGCMHHLMEYSGVPCHNMFTIRALKEKLCYVSQDSRDFTAAAAVGTCYNMSTFDVPEEQGGGAYTLGPQRFLAPEVLFNPMLFGLPYTGIHQAVNTSILKCAKLRDHIQGKAEASSGDCHVSRMPAQQGGDLATSRAVRTVHRVKGEVYLEQAVPAGSVRVDPSEGREGEGSACEGEGESEVQMDKFADVSAEDLETALRNVVVTGGTAAIPGLAERMLLELRKGLPASLAQTIRVHPNVNGYDSPWLGGKMLAQTSSFASSWCLTRDEYQKQGPEDLGCLAHTLRTRLRE